jgi:hypothetical protein
MLTRYQQSLLDAQGTGGGGPPPLPGPGDDDNGDGDDEVSWNEAYEDDVTDDNDPDEPTNNEVVEVPLNDALLVAFKYFLTRIGFSVDAIAQLLARGLSSMESLKVQDKSCVSDMCKCIERGTTGVPGTPLGSASIMWLKIGTYSIIRRQFCGWSTTASDLTKPELLKWKNYMESEEDYKEPTTPPNAEKDKLFLDMSKTFKLLELYICWSPSPSSDTDWRPSTALAYIHSEASSSKAR